MTTRELIEAVRKLDPKGDMPITVWDMFFGCFVDITGVLNHSDENGLSVVIKIDED